MTKHYANGIHDITNNAYHRSSGVSRSMLMELKKSPYHYWYKYLSGKATPEEATPAMNLGSAVHCLALEPDLFDDEFYVVGSKKRPTKGSASYTKMLDESEGRIVLNSEEYEQAKMMAHSVRTNTDCIALLKDCQIEQSIYFTHKPTGLQSKVRPDAWLGGVICDLKTCLDASERAFMSSAMNYGYYLQAGMTAYALQELNIPFNNFVDILVEKYEPYAVALYVLNDEAIEYGLNLFDQLMGLLYECTAANKWPGFGINTVGLPAWAKYESLGSFM